MPYRSAKQRRYIHMKAAAGVPWAKRFVKHSPKKVKRRGV